MKKLTKVQITAIEKAVNAQFLNGVSEDETAQALFLNGVPFSEIKSMITETAHKLELILSPEAIQEKVSEGLKDGTKPSNFYDVVSLANDLKIPQLSTEELLTQVQKHFKTNLRASSKYTCLFNGKGKYGELADWVRKNPDFTPAQILDCGVVEGAQAEDYYNQFIGFRDLFKSLEA